MPEQPALDLFVIGDKTSAAVLIGRATARGTGTLSNSSFSVSSAIAMPSFCRMSAEHLRHPHNVQRPVQFGNFALR